MYIRDWNNPGSVSQGVVPSSLSYTHTASFAMNPRVKMEAFKLKMNPSSSNNFINLIFGILFLLIGSLFLYRYFVSKKKNKQSEPSSTSSSSFNFGYPI